MKLFTPKKISIEEICRVCEATIVKGDPSFEIKCLCTPEDADEDCIIFIWDKTLSEKITVEKTGCVLTLPSIAENINAKNILSHPNPRKAFALFLRNFTSSPWLFPTNREGFYIKGENCRIDESALVYPFCFIGDNCEIDGNTIIYPFCYIGSNTKIGKNCLIFPGVYIYGNTKIGRNVRIHSGAIIGSDGFGYVGENDGWLKIEHRGGVIIEDDVEIGAGVCVDRGTIGDTVIGKGVKIDNLVHIAHNVKIGDNTLILAQTGISGSTEIGKNCLIGGQAGFTNNLKIGDRVSVGPKSGVHSDIKSNEVYTGYPAIPHRDWLRIMGALRFLPEMRKKLLKEKEK